MKVFIAQSNNIQNLVRAYSLAHKYSGHQR
jgi:hypothetical protein